MSSDEWPKFEIITSGRGEFLPLHRAGAAYDNGWAPVSMGSRVLLEDGSTRFITAEEQRMIVNAADDYSASK